MVFKNYIPSIMIARGIRTYMIHVIADGYVCWIYPSEVLFVNLANIFEAILGTFVVCVVAAFRSFCRLN